MYFGGDYLTAEIGILNRQGLVLAADSAVTIGNQRVFNTSNKVFTLGYKHFVGVMVFGNAEFMQHPWSILFNEYKKLLVNKVKNHIEDYGDAFIDYISHDARLNQDILQKNYLADYVQQLFKVLSDDMNQNVLSSSTPNISNVKEGMGELIKNLCSRLKLKEQFKVVYSKDTFVNGNKAYIMSVLHELKNYGEKLDTQYLEAIINTYNQDFLDLVYYSIMTGLFTDYSGIVIAGYGSKDIFPSIITYSVYCSLDGILIYSKDVEHSVKIEATSTENTATASIVPFAQSDVAQTILTGIAPELNDDIFENLSKTGLDKEKIKDFLQNLSSLQQRKFIAPMVNSVTNMSIGELADVAETLINLTEFKRKYTSDLATVGGPVDILAITCNEGPVWIKQKHYFDLSKNPEFSKRRGF